ncbi:MAG: hypothetical protein P8177_13795 [Gemmatimonadota bacterium]
MKGVRRGQALVLAMLLVLALLTLGLGSAAIGTREAVLAATLERTERARGLAETAVLDAVRAWSTRENRDLPPGSVRTHPDGGSEVERVGRTLFLVRATRGVPAGSGSIEASAAALVRTVDVRSLELRIPAAVTADEAVLDRGGIVADSGCGRPTRPGLLAGTASVGPGVEVAGDPPLAPMPVPAPPALEPAIDSLLDSLADLHLPPSTLTPEPRSLDGVCTTAPDNWGSTDPHHPCHGRLPLVHATGPLARVRGAVRATRIHVLDGAVRGDPCQVLAALSGPALDRPFRLPDRWWVPVF